METLRKAYDLVGRGMRRRWLLLVLLGVLASGLEAVGGVLVYVLLGLVTQAEPPVLPVVGNVLRFFPGLPTERLFLWASVLIAVFFLVRAVLLQGQMYVQFRVAENAGARLSAHLLEGYLSAPAEFLLQRNSAELIRNCYDSVQRLVDDVLIPAVRLLSEALVVLALLMVLLVPSPLIALATVAILLPLAFAMLRFVQPRLKALGKTRQEMVRLGLRMLQQGIAGARDIKILGRERYFSREFTLVRSEMARARYLGFSWGYVPHIGMETVLILFIVGFFAFSLLLGGNAVDALPVLALFAYAGLRLKPSLNQVLRSINSLRFGEAAVEQVYRDALVAKELRAATPISKTPEAPLTFERGIEAHDVWFRFQQGSDWVLRGVSLSIQRGEWIGIVGATGSGKTTLVDVLMGLLEPTQGSITVDGIDIQTYLGAWYQNLGMVSQSVFLLDDSLRRNIAFGVPDEEVDEVALQEVVTRAQLDEVVEGLPQGLDTSIGERGVRLSGGQRQRVAIARALYRDPAVLVLDEGTSALDTRTEAQLMSALKAFREGRTIISVAHRLSTVVDCDRILLMESGAVVDVGTYGELLVRSEGFRALVNPTATAVQ